MGNKPMMNTVQWSCSLDAQCDNCWHEFDVLSLPDCGDIIRGIAVCQSDKIIELECPECEHRFEAKTTY